MAMRYVTLFTLTVGLALGCSAGGYGDSTGPGGGSGGGGSRNAVDAVGVSSWSPSRITIKAGEAVTFRSSSSATHSVRFDDDVAGLPPDVGDFSNASRTATFATAGTFPYHCGIHPAMQGSVVVEP
jgi:plastocyanin